MKVGTPIDVLPVSEQAQTKYRGAWEAWDLLPVGPWLPVECANYYEVKLVQSAALMYGQSRMTTRVRGTTVYLGKKEEKRGGPDA